VLGFPNQHLPVNRDSKPLFADELFVVEFVASVASESPTARKISFLYAPRIHENRKREDTGGDSSVKRMVLGREYG
jgi:hypothetical protein